MTALLFWEDFFNNQITSVTVYLHFHVGMTLNLFWVILSMGDFVLGDFALRGILS